MDHDDIPYDKHSLSNTEIYVHPWQNTWESGHANRAYLLANEGYKVIGVHVYKEGLSAG